MRFNQPGIPRRSYVEAGAFLAGSLLMTSSKKKNTAQAGAGIKQPADTPALNGTENPAESSIPEVKAGAPEAKPAEKKPEEPKAAEPAPEVKAPEAKEPADAGKAPEVKDPEPEPADAGNAPEAKADDAASAPEEEPAKPAEEKKPEPEKAAAEERKAAEPEKEPQPFGSAGLRDDPPSPRSASGTGVIALISTAVLSCLIGGAVFYGLQMQGMLIEQDAKINALHGTLDRANAGRLSAEREVSSLKNSIRSVNHGFSSIRKDLGKQAAADAKLSKRMDDIEKSIAAVGNRDKVSEALRSQIEYWEIAEASFLADAAQRKLVLDHNPDAALTLLKGAAGILQGLGDEGTLSARKALESDIAKVAAMKRVDPSGIVMKLGTLVDMTGSLELHGFEENRPDAIDGTDNEPSSDISEWRQNLSRSWNKFLRNFVVVRYRAPGREYRLSPNGETLVRENLKSLLLTASLAVSREKDAEFRKSLSRIDSLLGEYFEKDGAHVKEFRAALDEIRQTGDITFSPEDLESQNILRKLVTARRLDVGSLAALDDKGSAGKTDGGR